MEEKIKMLSGKLYNAEANYLKKDRINCKLLCQKYNNLPYDAFDERNNLIKKIVGRTGNNFFIEQFFICDYGYNIEIGENFYSNHNLTILDCAKVKFGNNVFIAPNCSFYTACHPIDVKTRNSLLEYAKPITVKDNVWIGGSTTVLAGVTIGENSVIGANSVVTKDIPSNVVAAGNPCKIIRKIDN